MENRHVARTNESVTTWKRLTARFWTSLAMDCSDPIPPFHFGSTLESETPRDLRCDTQIVARAKLSLAVDDLPSAVYFDGSGSPRIYGLQVVNRQSYQIVPVLDILVFQSLMKNILAMAPNIEVLAVELKPHRYNIRLTLS
jgi:hypothetical protein